MSYDAELTELRERVDCRAVLERAGWQLNRRESSRRSAKYRRAEGEIIVVTHDGKGWFDPLGEASRGDVLALAQRLWGGTLGHARKALRPLAGIAPSLLPETVDAARPLADCATAWLRRAPPRPGSAAWRYLTEVRALPPDLLTRLGKIGLIREGRGQGVKLQGRILVHSADAGVADECQGGVCPCCRPAINLSVLPWNVQRFRTLWPWPSNGGLTDWHFMLRRSAAGAESDGFLPIRLWTKTLGSGPSGRYQNRSVVTPDVFANMGSRH